MDTSNVPGKLRSVDAGSEQSLRPAKPPYGLAEFAVQVLCVFWDAVGQRPFQVIPHQLIGIQLRCIGWQEMDVQPAIPAEEVGDNRGSVGQAPIPQQHDVSVNVPQKVLQELHDLWGTDVLVRMKSTVQSKTPVPGRNGQGRDGRDFGPGARSRQNRCSPSGCPGAGDRGNK
jgi:hypothetical protein